MTTPGEVIRKKNLIGFVDKNTFTNICEQHLKAVKDLPVEEFYFHNNTCYGGVCFYCGKPWNERRVKNLFADYVDFKPTCDCYSKKQRENEMTKRLRRKYEQAGIPAEYIMKDFTTIDHERISASLSGAIQQTLEYIRNGVYKKRGLIIHGSIGTGKSHVGVAVLKKPIEENQKCFFISAVDLISEVFENRKIILKKIRASKYVMIDDIDKIGAGKGEEKNQYIAEKIFLVIDSLISNGAKIIGTSNYGSVKEFDEKLDKSITSRLIGACDFILFEGQDYRIITARGK